MTRDLDVGQTLSSIFAIYRDQAAVLLPVAAVLFVIEAIVGGLLFAISPVLIVLAVLVQIVAITLYTGMVVSLVDDVRDGRRDHTVGELFGAVGGVVVPLVLAGLIVGVAAAVGFVLLIVPGLVVLTIFAVVGPAIVLERQGVGAALKRSRELVSGNGLRVFAVVFVVFLLSFAVSVLVAGIGSSAGTGGRILGDFIASTLTAPLGGLAAAVLYFELRAPGGSQPPAGPESVPVL